MRILLSADYKARNSGNFIGCLLTLTRFVKKQGGEIFFAFPKVDYIFPWADKLEKTSGTEIIYVSEEQRKSVDYLNKLITDKHIDLIHDHFSFFRHLILHNPKGVNEVKVLIHDHMGFTNNKASLKERVKNCAVSLLCRYYGFGIASVLKTKDNSYRYDFGLHWYVPNGLSMERNIGSTLSSKDCRHLLGINEKEKMILILGWDMHRKGLDIAIKALELIRKDDSTYILGFVGGGNSPSQILANWIYDNCNVDPSSSWIHYLESTEDIFAYFRAADIYLSPSRSEGFPYSILEAVSQNTPCVLSDIDSQIWARNYTNAVYFKNGNYMECANAIKRASVMNRSNTNSDILLEKYSDENWSKHIIDIYNKLLAL